MSNEEALTHMQNNYRIYTVYVVNKEEAPLLHITC
jgi:hypothetical protein